MKRLDPAALDCLAALVDEGSFERAAQRLSITQSAVSQRLRALEGEAGQPLVVRTRPLRLTEAGQVLLRYARQLQALRADVARELGERSDGDDRLAIAVNADSLASWVLPALQPLVDEGLSLELVVDDQDFTHDWLREGRVLGCVSTVSEALRGCSITPLCVMSYVAVASPDFVRQQLGLGGLQRGNFSSVPFVVFNRKDDTQLNWISQAFGISGVRLRQCFVPSSEASIQAVLRGWGIGVVPWILVREHIERQALHWLLPQVSVDMALYWHQWRLGSSQTPGSGRGAMLDRVGLALGQGARPPARFTPR